MRLRGVVCFLVFLPIAVFAAALHAEWRFPDRGLSRELWRNDGFAGEPVQRRGSGRIEVGFVDGMGLETLPFSVRWEGVWRARGGRYALEAEGIAGAGISVRVEGRQVLSVDVSPAPRATAEFLLREGDHRVTVEYANRGGPQTLELTLTRYGGRERIAHRFDREELYPRLPEADERAPLALAVALIGGALSMASLLVAGAPTLFGREATRVMATPVASGRRWWRSADHSARASAVLAALFPIAYVALLLSWFGDPGSLGADGIRFRANPNWAAFLLAAALGAALLWRSRRRLGRMRSEAAAAWSLERIDVVVLAALLLLAAAAQIPVIRSSGGALDSDAALHGLAAMHIYEGRPANAFIYGKLYLGSLSSHLLAALFYVTGPTVAGLLVVTRLWFLVFLTAQFLLLWSGFGRRVAVAVVLWLALPPQLLLRHLVYTEYAELLAFASIALMVGASRVSGRLKDDLWYLVGGLALGIGFWSHQLLAPTILGVAVALFLLCDAHEARGALHYASGGFVLGALPAIVGWGSGFGEFVGFVTERRTPDAGSAAAVVGKLSGFFGELMPMLTGLDGLPRPGATLLTWLTVPLLVVPLGWAFLRLRRRRRGSAAPPSDLAEADRSPARVTAVLLATAILFHLLLYVAADFGVTDRHQVPMYLGLPGLLFASMNALFVRISGRVSSFVLGVASVTLIGLSLPGTITWWSVIGKSHRDIHTSIAAIEEAGVSRCRARYWDAYRLNYTSLERIICFSTDLSREPYYREIVRRAYPNLDAPLVVRRVGRREFRGIVEGLGTPVRVIETPTFQVAVPLPERSR